MNNLDVLSIVSLILSTIALTLACLSISITVGFKNSTHKIEWKPLPVKEDDPMKEEAQAEDTLRKEFFKQSQKVHKLSVEPEAQDEPFADLDDPNEVSHNW